MRVIAILMIVSGIWMIIKGLRAKELKMRIQRLKDKTLWIAAANDQEVDTVIISAGTWSKCFVEKTERKSVLMERNCDDCIFAQRSGGCVAWNCEPIPIRGAEKAWKEKNAPTPLTIEERTAKSIAELEETLKNAPTAKPGLVAHWEYLGHRPGIMKHPMSVDYRCTNCGYEAYWLTPEVCPNCGAKMDEVGR